MTRREEWKMAQRIRALRKERARRNKQLWWILSAGAAVGLILGILGYW